MAVNTLPAVYDRGYLARQGSGTFPHITREQVQQILSRGSGVSWQTLLIIRALWATGSRISETLALRCEDLDRGRRILKIRRLKRRKEFIQEIPIPQDLTDLLTAWMRERRKSGRQKIFHADRFSAWESIKNLGWKVLRLKISPKMFRHGVAYELVKLGVHPLLVSRALGHASLSSALSYYHPQEEDLRRVMEMRANQT